MEIFKIKQPNSITGGIRINPVTLSVGDTFHLKRGKDRIICTGMPSENACSIVQKKREFTYQGFAWYLFYPRNRTEITIDRVDTYIENVNSDEIKLRVSK